MALRFISAPNSRRCDPDFIAGPLFPGQSIFLESLVYRFENGLIQSIRSFRASAPRGAFDVLAWRQRETEMGPIG